ncbi:MAG: hypothetical protein AAF804_00565, partial [Bacteroidota bacterium]
MDNGNAGNGSDVEINFDQQTSTVAVEAYRIFLVKADQAANQGPDFFSQLDADQYTEVQVDEIFPLQGKVLGEQAKDSDGDILAEGQSYRVVVMTVSIDPDEVAHTLTWLESAFSFGPNPLISPHTIEFDAGAGSMVRDQAGDLLLGTYDIQSHFTLDLEKRFFVYRISTQGGLNKASEDYSL